MGNQVDCDPTSANISSAVTLVTTAENTEMVNDLTKG